MVRCPSARPGMCLSVGGSHQEYADCLRWRANHHRPGRNVKMIAVRPAAERGNTRTGWLDSRHTFSFNRYYDPRYMGFRTLRVINEDNVIPGAGFGTHSHSDMEI